MPIEHMAGRFGKKWEEFIGLWMGTLCHRICALFRRGYPEKVVQTKKFVRDEEKGLTGWFESIQFPIFDLKRKLNPIQLR